MKAAFATDNRMMDALRGFSKHNVPLKIFVKARDEVELTKGWIEHHAKIVGLENLLIADNSSTLPEVFEIYESFGPSLNWFSFSGHHDGIQNRRNFPQLYTNLASSCRYAMSIDMDERVLGFTENTWHADSSIPDRLARTSASLISAPWLQNTSGHDDQFELYREQLEWGVIFGKPVINTNNPSMGTGLIHTVHYPVNDMDFLALGVLHLSQFSVAQRLRTNKNKLIQHGVVTVGTSYEEIASMIAHVGLPEPLVTVRCIEEVQRLMSQSDGNLCVSAPPERCITLTQGGQLIFGSLAAQQLFTEFLQQEREMSLAFLPKSPTFLPENGDYIAHNSIQ